MRHAFKHIQRKLKHKTLQKTLMCYDTSSGNMQTREYENQVNGLKQQTNLSGPNLWWKDSNSIEDSKREIIFNK